ncbi:MAG: hypothetical protein ACC631_09985, partial [Halocynthiibacter sp.]
MTKRYPKLFLAIIISFFVLGSGLAQTLVPKTNVLTQLAKDLGKLDQAFEKSTLSEEEILKAERLGLDIRRRSLRCIASVKSEIDLLKALIGEVPKADPGSGATGDKIGDLQKELATCRDIALRADAADNKLVILKNQLQAEKFGSRGRNAIDTIAGAFSATADWESVWHPIRVLFESPRVPSMFDWALIVGSMLLGAGLGLRLRLKPSNGAGLAPVVMGAAGLMTGLTFTYAPNSVEAIVIGWRVLAIGCLMLLSASLPRPAVEPDRKRTGWRIGGFLLATLAGYHLSFAFENALPIPEVELVRLIVFAVIIATAIPATRHIRFLPLFEWIWKPVRAFFLLGFAIAIVAEFLGYRAFATYIL